MLTPGKGFDRVTPPGWWSTGPSTRHEVETAWGVRAEPHKAVESGNPERQTSLVPNPPRLSASCECEQVTLEIVSAHGAGGRARGRGTLVRHDLGQRVSPDEELRSFNRASTAFFFSFFRCLLFMSSAPRAALAGPGRSKANLPEPSAPQVGCAVGIPPRYGNRIAAN
jgi:hypothetical protein